MTSSFHDPAPCGCSWAKYPPSSCWSRWNTNFQACSTSRDQIKRTWAGETQHFKDCSHKSPSTAKEICDLRWNCQACTGMLVGQGHQCIFSLVKGTLLGHQGKDQGAWRQSPLLPPFKYQDLILRNHPYQQRGSKKSVEQFYWKQSVSKPFLTNPFGLTLPNFKPSPLTL